MNNFGLISDITWNATFIHGEKYYITVEACNVAGLCKTLSSDGVLLDNSPPIPGWVQVGSSSRNHTYLPRK